MQDIVDHWRDVGLHSVRRGRKGGFCRKDIYFQRLFLAFLGEQIQVEAGGLGLLC